MSNVAALTSRSFLDSLSQCSELREVESFSLSGADKHTERAVTGNQALRREGNVASSRGSGGKHCPSTGDVERAAEPELHCSAGRQ